MCCRVKRVCYGSVLGTHVYCGRAVIAGLERSYRGYGYLQRCAGLPYGSGDLVTSTYVYLGTLNLSRIHMIHTCNRTYFNLVIVTYSTYSSML